MLIVRYFAACAALVLCGTAVATAPTATLAVTVTVARSAPVVRFIDAKGRVVAHGALSEAAFSAAFANVVMYKVVEY